MRRGPSIGRMLFGLNAFVLLVPVLALVLLRIFESQLVEQTERRLVGEAAVIGETYREFLLDARGQTLEADPDMLPPSNKDARFWSVHPVIDIDAGFAPAAPRLSPRQSPPDSDALAAGARLKTVLARVTRLNLSSVYVMDGEGCIVAATAGDAASSDRPCMHDYPEVQGALRGTYSAVLRERPGGRSIAPPDPISRHGDTRVFVALPVFYKGAVIGVVRVGRTSLNTIEALWHQRNPLLLTAFACLLLTLGISWYLSRAIGRPMRVISDAARAVAQGAPRSLSPQGTVPAEVADMSQSLDRMTEQLNQRAAYVREFAATASHELKTPITAIRGATELLSDSWETMTAEQRQRFIGNIDKDAARMEAVVRRLLELARIENAASDGETVEPFDAVEAVRQLVPADVAVVATRPHAALEMNRAHFETAVRSLIDNAMEHGAEPVEVHVGTAEGRVWVEVKDHGAGVSEGNRHRIFERFFTTRRDEGGTGLGLAIAQAIAERREGSVSYRRDGAMSCFRLEL